MLKDAYLCNKNFSGIYSWSLFVKKLLNHLDINEDCSQLGSYKFNKILDKKLRQKLIDNWYEMKDKKLDGKLCTYLKVKENFGPENYLTLIKNTEQRKAFCRFRISAHKLQIEIQRYTKTKSKDKILRSKRVCKNCSSQEIEDELHFLCVCPKFNKDSDWLMNMVSKMSQNFFFNFRNDSKHIFH